MPSLRHHVLAYAVPRLRRACELTDEPAERGRVERWHAGLDRSLPTRVVPGFSRRWSVHTEDLAGFPVHTLSPRDVATRRTVLYIHGGAYMAPIDPFHVRYVTRLAGRLGARIVLPDYPLAPEHTWRDSFEPLLDLAAGLLAEPGAVLAGDSAGGGYALALALGLRDRGLGQAERMLLHSPWVDLTLSAPGTAAAAAWDPWLFPGKARAYAAWWAGADEPTRPELSPGLGDLAGLPPTLMQYGTRDLLAPGCQELARRAADAGWALTADEQPGLLHVYALMPVPEARAALERAIAFLR